MILAPARLFGLLAVFALGGCAVGPAYRTPAPPSPSSAAFAAAKAETLTSQAPPQDWWRLYDVPALNELVHEALAHNKTLVAAAANLRQARGALALASAGRYPSTALTAGAQDGVTELQDFGADLKGLPPPNAEGYYTLGLDASYEVDLFGRVRRTIEAAKADVEAARAAEDAVRVSVAGETTRAYLNACAYAHELAVAKQSLDLTAKTYDLTVDEARYGAASDFDVVRAKQAVSQTAATLPSLEGQRRTALFELAVLTGKPPEEISKAADVCTQAPTLAAPLPTGDVKSLFRRRPDVRQAERQLAASVARIGVSAADFYPTITLGVSAGSSATSLGGLVQRRNASYAVGPLLSWTFPNTAVASAEVRSAKAAASGAYANFEAAVLQALQDTEEALTAYNAEADRHRALQASRDQSVTAFKLAGAQYANGAASYLDVLSAQSNVVAAEAALAASDEAMASDEVTVFKALGGGWQGAPNVKPDVYTAAEGANAKPAS